MTNEINFSFKPTLEGERVLLRPFKEEDYEIMIKILSDYEVRKLTGSSEDDMNSERELTHLEKENIISWYETRNLQDDRLDLGIVNKATNELVGEAVFNEYDEENKSINFRILIGENGRGKGLGTEVTKLFLDYGFKELNLERVELEVYSFNPRAEHVYIKSGFKLIDVLKDEFEYNGEPVDAKCYELLRSDYIKKE